MGTFRHYFFAVPVLDYFPQALRALRDIRGLDRDELGRRAGVGGAQIGRYERGEQTPDFERLEELARALETESEGLLSLMVALKETAEAGPEGEGQLRLFSAQPGEVAEKDTVAKILYITDTGIVVLVDDPSLNRWLADELAALSPERRMILRLGPKG